MWNLYNKLPLSCALKEILLIALQAACTLHCGQGRWQVWKAKIAKDAAEPEISPFYFFNPHVNFLPFIFKNVALTWPAKSRRLVLKFKNRNIKMSASKSPEPTRGQAMYNFRLLVNLSYRRLKNFWWFEIKVFASASVVYMRFTKTSKITLWETFILILNVTSECWRDVRKRRHHLDVCLQSSGLRAPTFRFSATVKISSS